MVETVYYSYTRLIYAITICKEFIRKYQNVNYMRRFKPIPLVVHLPIMYNVSKRETRDARDDSVQYIELYSSIFVPHTLLL